MRIGDFLNRKQIIIKPIRTKYIKVKWFCYFDLLIFRIFLIYKSPTLANTCTSVFDKNASQGRVHKWAFKFGTAGETGVSGALSARSGVRGRSYGQSGRTSLFGGGGATQLTHQLTHD